VEQKEQTKILCKELAKIQQKLRVGKNLENTFGHYKYRNAEGILEALKEVMPEGYVSVCSTQVLPNGTEVLTETFTDGVNSISSSVAMPVPTARSGMSIEQVYGCRISYTRKYALGMLYAIDDSKDDPDSKPPVVFEKKNKWQNI
jgi:hypothetical protein